MYKIVLVTCFMTMLLLSGVAQTMPLPSMDVIRANLQRAHTDTGRAGLMLDLALSYVFRPGEDKIDLDSAMRWVRQVENINREIKDQRIQAKSWFVCSNILREGGDAAGGRAYSEKSLAVYKTIDAPSEMGEAWIEEANYYSGDSSAVIRKKKAIFQQALVLFERAGNKQRQADVLKNIGDFEKVLDEDRRLAMKDEKEALAIYQSIGYPRLYGVYIILVDLCHEEGDYSNMLRYCELAVKNAEAVGDTSMQLARIYGETGAAYDVLGNYESAAIFYKKAIGIVKIYGDRERLVYQMSNLCHTLVMLERNAEALIQLRELEGIVYSHPQPLDDVAEAAFLSIQLTVYGVNKQYDRSTSAANEFIRLLKRHPATDKVYLFANLLVIYFRHFHQWEQAEVYADSVLRHANSENTKQVLADSYELKSKSDSAIGDLRGALINYQLFKKETDSAFNEASSFQLAQLQVEFETEKKDNAIKFLEQQREIQQAGLERSRTVNTIVLIGVIVLALLLLLLYSRYRIKQRLNAALEQLVAEKDSLIREKDSLVKEIHHRVKNNLQIVISLLNAQTEFLESSSAVRAIRESRERMEAIAILHQKLYQIGNKTLIPIRAYIYDLVDNLQDSFANARDIYFQLDIADITIDVSQSLPLGLILNEAITNALKYAYPRGERGTVSISLQPTDGERVELRIADNGAGLPSDFDWKNPYSLGLQLINLLTEQLKGKLYFVNKNGLEIVLVFKPCGIHLIK